MDEHWWIDYSEEFKQIFDWDEAYAPIYRSWIKILLKLLLVVLWYGFGKNGLNHRFIKGNFNPSFRWKKYT